MSGKNKQATPGLRGDQIEVRGRSSRSNGSGRFEPYQRERVDDGWTHADEDENERVETTLTAENAKTILSRNDSPDIGFDRSVNPYRGCEHGCIYRFALPGARLSRSCRPASISRPSCSSSLTPRRFCGPSSHSPAACRIASSSARTPTATSRSRSAFGSRAASSRCSPNSSIRSASPRRTISSPGTSICSLRWPRGLERRGDLDNDARSSAGAGHGAAGVDAGPAPRCHSRALERRAFP